MTPTLSGNVTQSSARSSAAPVATAATITTVNVAPILTTTITSSGSGSLPTAAAISHSNAPNIPIGAIAGGAAAGVVLALVAVVGWTWWGRCIRRKTAKERTEALAFLKVRENTRRNASTLSHPTHQYKPPYSVRGQHERKVKFASTTPSSGQSTLKGTAELQKAGVDSEKFARQPIPRPSTPPVPLKDAPRKPETGLAPPLPRRSPQRERVPVVPIAPSDSYTQHRLMHQASTLSSGSVYSTQSAMEEGQAGVPSSLLLALANEGNRRSLLASYLPWNRYRNSIASNNRLSEYSTYSVSSQFEDQPWESVGYAYGEEEELPRR